MSSDKLLVELNNFAPCFQMINDCYLLVSDVDENNILEMMAFYKGDLMRLEEDCNRFFIVRDFLDEINRNYKDFSDGDLVKIAKEYRCLLDEGLRNAFPGIKFEIEIIGENLVDIEPLELCVTFKKFR